MPGSLEEKRNDLIQFVEGGDLESIKTMLGKDPQLFDIRTNDNLTLLAFAVQKGQKETVQYFLKHEQADSCFLLQSEQDIIRLMIHRSESGHDINDLNDADQAIQKRTTSLLISERGELCTFVEEGDLNSIKNVDLDVLFNTRTSNETTLLMIAVQKGQKETVQYFLDQKEADLDYLTAKNKDGNDALLLSIKSSDSDMAKSLLQTIRERLNSVEHANANFDYYRNITLGWLAAKESKWDLFERFQEEGGDINVRPVNEGLTIAWFAARDEQWGLLGRFLNTEKVDINVRPTGEGDPSEGVTIFWLAVLNNKDDIVKIIRNYSHPPTLIFPASAI